MHVKMSFGLLILLDFQAFPDRSSEDWESSNLFSVVREFLSRMDVEFWQILILHYLCGLVAFLLYELVLYYWNEIIWTRKWRKLDSVTKLQLNDVFYLKAGIGLCFILEAVEFLRYPYWLLYTTWIFKTK